jgi:hypothetical protein
LSDERRVHSKFAACSTASQSSLFISLQQQTSLL